MANKKDAPSHGRHTKDQTNNTPSKRKMQPASQRSRVYRHLEMYGSITQAEAIDKYQCYRLSSRIKEMRDDGANIVTIMEDNASGRGQHARYFLRKERKES